MTACTCNSIDLFVPCVLMAQGVASPPVRGVFYGGGGGVGGRFEVCCAVNFSRGGGVLPYMGYIGMCRCEGYGFQAVYSSIGYINQSVWT